jgi:hypothetical protein
MRYVLGKKMSRNAVAFETHDQDGKYLCLVGSPNDILKGIRYAEENGYYPFFLDGPILRNGRRYELTLNKDTRYWHVSRAV